MKKIIIIGTIGLVTLATIIGIILYLTGTITFGKSQEISDSKATTKKSLRAK